MNVKRCHISLCALLLLCFALFLNASLSCHVIACLYALLALIYKECKVSPFLI